MIENHITDSITTSLEKPPIVDLTVEQLYDKLLIEAGGFGRYQFISTTVFISGYALMGTVLYGMLFFELFPAYQCRLSQSDPWVSCTSDEICNNDYPEHQVDWSNDESLHNWVG
jgi:hypothetical protein